MPNPHPQDVGRRSPPQSRAKLVAAFWRRASQSKGSIRGLLMVMQATDAPTATKPALTTDGANDPSASCLSAASLAIPWRVWDGDVHG